MRFEREVVVDAPVETVWGVYSDVERWSEWTASITRVEYVDGGDLTPGARVRIRQPKLPTALWEVTTVEPGRSWTWEAKGPGIRTIASHELQPTGAGACRVRMTLIQQGPLGAVLGRLYARLTREYLALEAAGLKQRCEAHRPA